MALEEVVEEVDEYFAFLARSEEVDLKAESESEAEAEGRELDHFAQAEKQHLEQDACFLLAASLA